MLSKSKERIKEFGEVFTPEHVVEEMLDLISQNNPKVWADLEVCLFEPTCGTGNFVVAIYKRRLEALKNLGVFEAITETLDTLWAIDIDYNNILACRSRIIDLTFQFIEENLAVKISKDYIKKHYDFFLHFICAVQWQIHRNEALTALSCPDTVRKNANKTKASKEWFETLGHFPIDIDLTWCSYYKKCQEEQLIYIKEIYDAELFLESLKFDA
jgi:hypothetical protein